MMEEIKIEHKFYFYTYIIYETWEMPWIVITKCGVLELFLVHKFGMRIFFGTVFYVFAYEKRQIAWDKNGGRERKWHHYGTCSRAAVIVFDLKQRNWAGVRKARMSLSPFEELEIAILMS